MSSPLPKGFVGLCVSSSGIVRLLCLLLGPPPTILSGSIHLLLHYWGITKVGVHSHNIIVFAD